MKTLRMADINFLSTDGQMSGLSTPILGQCHVRHPTNETWLKHHLKHKE